MELRHLRYFVAVAEELNIRRAAARLHVSQPPLTRQIRDLETEIKAQLFERSKQGVRLTDAGLVFLSEARQILAHSERAVRFAREVLRGEAGRLTVAVPPMALDRALSRVMRQLLRRYPRIQLQIRELRAHQQFAALLEKNVDIGYCPFRSANPELVFKPVRRAAMCAVLPPGHPLAKQRRFPLSALVEEPFISPARDGVPYYEWYINICRNAGFEPKVVQDADTAQSLLNMVSAGIGVGLIPETMRTFQSASDVEIRELYPETPHLTFHLAWRRDDSSPAVKSFLEIFTDQIEIGTIGKRI